MKTLVTTLIAGLSCSALSAHATNGMNLEGFGPIAMGMGGASMAYDSGLAAMMNNPATLALTPQGDQMALAVHYLGPDVAVEGVAESGGDAYFMPALGWGRKAGKLTYGVGLFAQGGMGTEYGSTSPLSMGTGREVRSELGVGRLIFPVAYELTPDLAIGASLDYVWAMLDVAMVATNAQIEAMGGTIDPAELVHIAFSDGSDFTGKAKGSGWAGKLGVTYKASPALVLGASYHSKTSLSDLETSVNGATMSLYDDTGLINTMTGKMAVLDFQWPETYAIGLAWQVNPKLMLAADIRRILWSDVMQNFRMSFGGQTLTMPQDWRNQNVFALGAQYRVSDRLGVRVGFNYGKNPVPDAWLSPLFPATVERHYTAGFDYHLNDKSGVAAALSYAPEVSDALTMMPTTVTHSQLSAMIGYNLNF